MPRTRDFQDYLKSSDAPHVLPTLRVRRSGVSGALPAAVTEWIRGHIDICSTNSASTPSGSFCSTAFVAALYLGISSTSLSISRRIPSGISMWPI